MHTMTLRRHLSIFCLSAVLCAALSRTALARGDATSGRDLLQRPAPLVFQSSGATAGSVPEPKHPGSPTGVVIDEHEYLGPLVGEVNANGSPVTFAQQQQGMLQHSEDFGRYSAEDAPAALPFDASGTMQPAVQQDPCISQAQANKEHVGVPLWCNNASGRRTLQQSGSFASGGSSGLLQPTVVDMTNSQLEQEMLGSGPQDASINPGVGNAGVGNIAHIEHPAGVDAVIVPEPNTPTKVAGGGVSADGGATSMGKVKGRKLQQSGGFASGGSSGVVQPTVVDMTNSELEQEMMGSGPRIAAINPDVNSGGGSVGVLGGASSIAHIEQPAGEAAVVVPEPRTPAKVAGSSAHAAGKLSGRRMLQQGATGAFAGSDAGSAVDAGSAAQTGVVEMTDAQLVQAILGNSPHDAGIYNAAAAGTRQRPH